MFFYIFVTQQTVEQSDHDKVIKETIYVTCPYGVFFYIKACTYTCVCKYLAFGNEFSE